MLESRNYEVAITTFDNPYNPLDNFEEWFSFDVEKQYNTCGHLARLTHVTDDMSQREELEEIERGIDRMIELDFMNIYKKITRKIENNDEENELENNDNPERTNKG